MLSRFHGEKLLNIKGKIRTAMKAMKKSITTGWTSAPGKKNSWSGHKQPIMKSGSCNCDSVIKHHLNTFIKLNYLSRKQEEKEWGADIIDI